MMPPNEARAPVEARAETKKPLPTIWNVPDPLWELVEKVLAVYDPPAKTGRRRSDPRLAFDGVIYRMRTGCQWNHLPRECGQYDPAADNPPAHHAGPAARAYDVGEHDLLCRRSAVG